MDAQSQKRRGLKEQEQATRRSGASSIRSLQEAAQEDGWEWGTSEWKPVDNENASRGGLPRGYPDSSYLMELPSSSEFILCGNEYSEGGLDELAASGQSVSQQKLKSLSGSQVKASLYDEDRDRDAERIDRIEGQSKLLMQEFDKINFENKEVKDQLQTILEARRVAEKANKNLRAELADVRTNLETCVNELEIKDRDIEILREALDQAESTKKEMHIEMTKLTESLNDAERVISSEQHARKERDLEIDALTTQLTSTGQQLHEAERRARFFEVELQNTHNEAKRLQQQAEIKGKFLRESNENVSMHIREREHLENTLKSLTLELRAAQEKIAEQDHLLVSSETDIENLSSRCREADLQINDLKRQLGQQHGRALVQVSQSTNFSSNRSRMPVELPLRQNAPAGRPTERSSRLYDDRGPPSTRIAWQKNEGLPITPSGNHSIRHTYWGGSDNDGMVRETQQMTRNTSSSQKMQHYRSNSHSSKNGLEYGARNPRMIDVRASHATAPNLEAYAANVRSGFQKPQGDNGIRLQEPDPLEGIARMENLLLELSLEKDQLESRQAKLERKASRRRADIVEKKQTAEKLEKVVAQINKLKLNLRRLKML